MNPGAFDGVVVMGDGFWKVKRFDVEVGVADPNPNDNDWLNVDGLFGTDPLCCCPNEGGPRA